MMHGHEKSDSVIVAVKPANKVEHSAAAQSTAELFAAEPVEPRAETKRNAGQQSTCGTQGQISVSQALERIRRVAKERKKEKFTSLLHHISIDLLGRSRSRQQPHPAGRGNVTGVSRRDPALDDRQAVRPDCLLKFKNFKTLAATVGHHNGVWITVGKPMPPSAAPC